MYKTIDLLDLDHSRAADLLRSKEYPWEILDKVKEFILDLGESLPQEEFDRIESDIWIAKDAKVAASSYIKGPCIIDHGTEVRHCAFIRGSALIGRDCVVGNSTEIKNVIIFDNVQVPHFNYVGDSILGFHAHMGAGAVTSNVKGDRSLVVIRDGIQKIETGRKKVGAVLGDYAEIGCNCVLNPGTVIGRRTTVYPLSSVRGVIPADSIYKAADCIVSKDHNQ